MSDLLRLWFGVSDPVDRRAYALSGFGLMTFKYVVEATVIAVFAGAIYWPWQFVNPLASMRTEMLHPAPSWVAGALLVWSLPFVWIALSMSVRRAADTGASPWLGLWAIVPVVNLPSMLVLCCLPSAPGEHWSPRDTSDDQLATTRTTLLALVSSLMFGSMMMTVSVYLLHSYGAALFVGTPLLMGTVAAYIYNRDVSRGFMTSVGLGLGAVVLGTLLLLLFALEGVICIIMALPMLIPLGGLGGMMGKAIADCTRRQPGELVAALLLLPLLASAEKPWASVAEFEVLTAVEINAPQEIVWQHVVDFPELPSPTQWYFRAGIACPQRARIVGAGVGAVRHCEFTTGTFVEPITAWEAPERLAFDVTEQPAPMFELSPYRHVRPPHLHGYLRTNRGEFRLVALPGNRTRLEGRTWYEFEMFPQAYWTLWSDWLIHRIHVRVLEHVKRLAEAAEPHATHAT